MTKTTVDDCSFCQIIRGEKPAYVVYEDNAAICILSRNQDRFHGHCLVIPKKHAESIFDIDDGELAALMKVVKRMSLELKDKLNAKGMHFLHTENTHLTVPHFAIHLYPNFKPVAFDMTPFAGAESSEE